MWGDSIPDISTAKSPKEVDIYDAALKRLYLMNWKITPDVIDKVSPKLLKIWTKINKEAYNKKQTEQK